MTYQHHKGSQRPIPKCRAGQISQHKSGPLRQLQRQQRL